MNFDKNIIEGAIRALNEISYNDIEVIKSLRSPPPIVRFIMEAVNVMFGYPAEWHYTKKLIGKQNFVRMLMNFDRDNMKDEILEKLEPYVTCLTINPKKVKKSCSACYSIWNFVVATYKYGCYINELKRRIHLKI